MRISISLIFLPLFFIFTTLNAQNQVIKLYEGAAPGSEAWKHSEKENNDNFWRTRIVYNVAEPTLTVFKPEAGKANGSSIVICPGGGFHALSIDSEGFDVAKWLAKKGMTCFVLKYRLVECKTDNPPQELMTKGTKIEEDVKPIIPLALNDGLAAIAYVRKNAKTFNLNPNKIGITGFSAGGTVTASVAYNYTEESKPNFIAPIYLQYDWAIKSKVPADAPPMFILAATDDELGLASHSIKLYNDWTGAKKSAELHLYANGGHGFGMRTKNLPTDRWIELLGTWLEAQGFWKK
jgi:acetyl esterase/lipase